MASTGIKLTEQKSLSLEAAVDLAAIAVAEAAEAGLRLHVSIVDAAGHLLAYNRMPGAPYPARLFSERKAFTAVSFKKPTSVWKQRLAENPHLAAGLSQHPQVTMIAGGLPIFVGGAVVGAIGIAGGLEEDDERIARAALEKSGLAEAG